MLKMPAVIVFHTLAFITQTKCEGNVSLFFCFFCFDYLVLSLNSFPIFFLLQNFPPTRMPPLFPPFPP